MKFTSFVFLFNCVCFVISTKQQVKGANAVSAGMSDCLADPKHKSACHCEGLQSHGIMMNADTKEMSVRLSCFNDTLGDEETNIMIKALLLSSGNNTDPIGNMLTTIQLDKMQLNRIPDSLPLFNRLENVYIRNNNIQSIGTGTFNFASTLRRLDLSSNGLSRIEPGAFQGHYGDGSWIILNHNHLTQFESGVFQSVLEEMTAYGGTPHAMIHIEDNPIDCETDPCHLAWLIRDHRRLLKSLSPTTKCSNGTLFTQLDKNGFKNCSMPLEVVDIEMNPINNVPSPCPPTELIFPCSCEVYGPETGNSLWVDCASRHLDDDEMSRILDAFVKHSDPGRFRLLHLRDNQLSHVPQQVRYFSQLTRVNLGNNKIETIKSDDFNFPSQNTGHSLELWLNSNELKKIEAGAFDGFYGDASFIILNDNHLKELDSSVFESILEQMVQHKDASIRVSHNAFDCTKKLCHFQWLVRDNPRLISVVQDGMCSNGTKLSKLKSKGFNHCASTYHKNSIASKFDRPEGPILTWVFVGVVIVVVLFAMAVFIYKYQKKRRVFQGIQDLLRGHVDPSVDINKLVNGQAETQAYTKYWEFPECRLQLGVQLNRHQLRKGGFNRIVKAEAMGLRGDKSEVRIVAVKTVLSQTSSIVPLEALVNELKLLIHLGSHLNIVNLLGACTKKISKGDLLVMFEYCRHGNLRNYLISQRKNFINLLDPKKEIETDKIISENNVIRLVLGKRSPLSSDAVQFHTQRENNGNHEEIQLSDFDQEDDNRVTGPTGNKIISTRDLICWSFQIARGMDFLASKKIFHGDLSACNILLAEEGVVKIANVAMARQIYSEENFNEEIGKKLPIKWMAPESLTRRTFSSQADVWSFGVLLWEIFSLGKVPYLGISGADQLIRQLEAGYRLEKPEYASSEIGQLMFDCWQPEPNERPTFHHLEESIGSHLDESVRIRYVDMNRPFVKLNEDGQRRATRKAQRTASNMAAATALIRRATTIFRPSRTASMMSSNGGVNNRAFQA